ncbi:hypothetical protein KIN20_009446 [Parelaphostrongylus tenuis]|uniref:Uncharacterized protein n=1 Tax=Parelaphostrongylus tenuis TaxID=148309 RepID=A0AAD5QJM0_PARTN|nr:hypothetical protein KIN20_009446 [Parelaphostrongylus tenuis]
MTMQTCGSHLCVVDKTPLATSAPHNVSEVSWKGSTGLAFPAEFGKFLDAAKVRKANNRVKVLAGSYANGWPYCGNFVE